jgi:PAS domain S-box-containing protein
MVTLWGSDGVMIYNDSYAEFAGQRHPQLLGSKVLEGWPEVADFNRRVMNVCYERGETLSYQDQHLVLSRNGRPEDVWLDLYYSPVFGENKPEGVLAVVVETTARVVAEQRRRQTENELIASEERFRAAFAHAATGVCIADLEGRILQANAAYCKITGYPEHELQKRDLISITHPDDVPHKRTLLGRMLNGEIPAFVVEKRYVRMDGSSVWVQNSVSLTRNATGEPANIIAITEDVTERRTAAQELLRSNEELQAFAYAASHDLQEPLRTLASFTQLLERRYKQQLDSNAQSLITEIVDAARRMDALITDLLGYTKAGWLEGAVMQPVDLQELAEFVAKDLQTAVRESGATVTISGLPTVKGNAHQLDQLLQNLILNAIKYRQAGLAPAIEVSAREQPGEWVISVADNGIGFRPEHAKLIFEPFKRLHGREIPGTGIGLALCRRIVERHGGRIWAESTFGHGATFSFTLPR